MLALEASTSRIVAPGAIAWAHSTSSDSSSAQPLSVFGCPCGVSFWKQLLHGKPNCVSKAARSPETVGSSNASTIAIVCPAPQLAVPLQASADTPYATVS